MTYFGFLARFVGIPILVLLILHWIDLRRGKSLPNSLRNLSWAWTIGALVVVAVVYTTPWDNYLVATRIWWYHEELVTGIVIGWVPIEEYTFFVLQTVMTGLFAVWLFRRTPVNPLPSAATGQAMRRISTLVLGIIWVISTVIMVIALALPETNWRYATYFGLEMSWGLIPIMLQTWVGADILWRYRRAVLIAVVTTWVYLSVADTYTIGWAGTWVINPEKSLPLLVGGVLPIEEAIFFLITNVLVVFGLTLAIEQTSENRVPQAVKRWIRQRIGNTQTPPLGAAE
ncbi:MAG: lycopene cyclase domain-containing protein [Phototrophicaceae bacterium]